MLGSQRRKQNKQSNAQLNVRKINFPNNFTVTPMDFPSPGPSAAILLWVFMHLSPAASNALFFDGRQFLSVFCYFFLSPLLFSHPRQRRQIIRHRAKSIAKSLQCVVPYQRSRRRRRLDEYFCSFSFSFTPILFLSIVHCLPFQRHPLRLLFCIVCSPSHCTQNGRLTIP